MMKALGLPLLLAILLATASTGAFARPDAEVESLQMPAWMVRDGQRGALAVGTRLRDLDEIQSGTGARVLLRLADGSTVKLGENARFRLDAMAQEPGHEKSLFRASLAVIEGAFRFTTEAVYKFRGRREVDVRFSAVTAGIRGTDLWGKAAPDRDIVCLIEGKITVTREGAPPLAMQEPKTVLQAPKQAAPLAVAPVEAHQLAIWAAETEIEPGAGAAHTGGTWKVYVWHSATSAEAEAMSARLREGGYATRIITVSESGKRVFWVYLGGMPNRVEALALAHRLRGRMGITETSVGF